MTEKITIKKGKVEVKSAKEHAYLHAHHLSHTHQKIVRGKIRYIRHET